jgi:hypothetical protein
LSRQQTGRTTYDEPQHPGQSDTGKYFFLHVYKKQRTISHNMQNAPLRCARKKDKKCHVAAFPPKARQDVLWQVFWLVAPEPPSHRNAAVA